MRSNQQQRQPAQRQQPAKRQQPRTQKEYKEGPGWGSAFRRDAEGNQPQFTGTVLDPDGDELQIAVWVKTPRNGGQKYLRVHLEPPYRPDAEDPLGDVFDGQSDGDSNDDIPF